MGTHGGDFPCNCPGKFEGVQQRAVVSAIEEADAGKQTQTQVTPRVERVTRESRGSIVFETRDRQAGAAEEWVHRSYLTQDPSTPAAAPKPAPRDDPNANRNSSNLQNQTNAPAVQRERPRQAE